MSLTSMGKGADSVRFLDDVDVTLSMDSRWTAEHQMTSIEISSEPIVFRASYRDINLIMKIVNTALERYSKLTASKAEPNPAEIRPRMAQNRSSRTGKSSRATFARKISSSQPRLVMSKERVSHVTCRNCLGDLNAHLQSSPPRLKASASFSLATCTSYLCFISRPNHSLLPFKIGQARCVL